MLRVITAKSERQTAQRRFEEMVRRAWPSAEQRMISWRPESKELEIAHDGDLWFASHISKNDAGERRFWNSFGRYHEAGNLDISVEINIPIDRNDGRVSGFLAIDEESGTVLILHDCGVGGGRPGVGRNSFLEWSSLKPIAAVNEGGKIRHGVIVAVLDRADDLSALRSFVKKVIAFKDAVSSGEIATGAGSSTRGTEYGNYFKEFSGLKSSKGARSYVYESRHGDVVDALKLWCEDSGRFNGRLVKNLLIDLGVERDDGSLECLFEVKTDTSRTCLYTAIGQLAVHAAERSTRRYLVIPDEEPIPADIETHLKASSIRILRFRLGRRRVDIIDSGG